MTDTGGALLTVAFGPISKLFGVWGSTGIVFAGMPIDNQGGINNYVFALNNQGWCLLDDDDYTTTPHTTGAIWYNGTATKFVDLLTGGTWVHQIQNIRPRCLSNANATDGSMYAAATEQDSALPPIPPAAGSTTPTPATEFAVWKYTQTPALTSLALRTIPAPWAVERGPGGDLRPQPGLVKPC